MFSQGAILVLLYPCDKKVLSFMLIRQAHFLIEKLMPGSKEKQNPRFDHNGKICVNIHNASFEVIQYNTHFAQLNRISTIHELKSRPCENSLADFCTSEVNPLKAQKADGQAFRIAKVRQRIFTWSRLQMVLRSDNSSIHLHHLEI